MYWSRRQYMEDGLIGKPAGKSETDELLDGTPQKLYQYKVYQYRADFPSNAHKYRVHRMIGRRPG
ncbi:hypothetical protein IF2G_03322 [Cordyceps javanica]|nr:hypothetical protein IF2G_03322 [Cordyceps javanica]